MTKHAILYPVLGLALVLCAVWIVKQEISVARAEERSQAHSDAIKEIQKVQAEKDKAVKEALDKLAQVKAKPATVQTITKYVPIPMPPKSEIKIETPEQGPPQIALTGDVQQNLDWIRNMEISHLECDTKLDSCQKDVTFAGQKLAEMTKDRDNWKNTAKGGSKTHRFFKVLKVTACAGGGAALGSLWKAKGAAIGGAAGAATCSVW